MDPIFSDVNVTQINEDKSSQIHDIDNELDRFQETKKEELYSVHPSDDLVAAKYGTDNSNSLASKLLKPEVHPLTEAIASQDIVPKIETHLTSAPEVKLRKGSLSKSESHSKSSLELRKTSSGVTVPPSIGDTPATPRSVVIKLWVVAVLTMVLCVCLMVAAHLTHSLTLRVEAYHSLYNIGALAGSLLSMKVIN